MGVGGSMTAMVDEANRLRDEGSSPEEIVAALTETSGRALDILRTGLGGTGSAEPSE
jgi:hypothetical protein